MRIGDGSKTTVALAAVFAAFLWIVPTSNCAAPPSGLKRFLLNEKVNSADISPNENIVAVERTIETKGTNGDTTFQDVVELWNFYAGTTIARATLRRIEAQPSQHADLSPFGHPRFIRFSNDGALLVAYLDNSITLFGATDLSPAGAISISVPDSETHSFKAKSSILVTTERPRVQAMEVSPIAPLLAILWVRGLLWGRLDVYDISSRQLVGQWVLPQGWVTFDRGHGLAWDTALPRVFVAVPSASPCGSAVNTPDIFSADVQTGKSSFKLSTGLIVGDIAITHDNKLAAVDKNCVGILKNHHPSMKVFALDTGKPVRKVKADTAVRYAVSVASRANRIVAWTSDVRCAFDPGDMVCNDKLMKAMFTVWQLPHFEAITEQQVSPPTGLGLQISAHGRFVLTYGNSVQVFQLN